MNPLSRGQLAILAIWLSVMPADILASTVMNAVNPDVGFRQEHWNVKTGSRKSDLMYRYGLAGTRCLITGGTQVGISFLRCFGIDTAYPKTI
jgi:hypothetical protein